MGEQYIDAETECPLSTVGAGSHILTNGRDNTLKLLDVRTFGILRVFRAGALEARASRAIRWRQNVAATKRNKTVGERTVELALAFATPVGTPRHALRAPAPCR